MEMQLFDKLTLNKPRRTNDGYLVVDARIARTGIQHYRGSEVGVSDKDIVAIYRPEGEVFKDESMASFAHKPVTDNHPPEMVSSKNWKDFAVGKTGGEIARDGEFLVIPLSVMDEASISQVESGKRELSAGYLCDLDMTPGTTPDGEAYDGIQTNIRANHLAIVDKGRAGNHCRIGDKKPGEDTMTTRKVTVDGITIDVTDQGAQVIEKLQGQLTDASAAMDTALKSHKAVIADKDKELATKDAEIDKLKKEVVSEDQLDQLATARASVIADAATLGMTDTKGKTNADIRRDAVASKLGDKVTADRSDEYIEARFDALVTDSGDQGSRDPAIRTLQGGASNKVVDSEAAYDAMRQGLEGAHLTLNKEAN